MSEGHFTLSELVGAGAYGVVVVAEHPAGRTVALKTIKPTAMKNKTFLARFRDEAKLLSLIRHPNVVEVERLLEHNHPPVLVMELVRGASLEQIIRAHPKGMAPEVCLDLVRQVAEGLHACWEAPGPDGQPLHVVHRDIKPANILVALDGTVKLVDLGIAKGQFVGREAVTIMDDLRGTSGYMPPEWISGLVDHASLDVYSLGKVLFQLLTGKELNLPKHPDKHDASLNKACEVAPLADDPAMKIIMADLLKQMLEYDPDDRPTSGRLADIVEAMQGAEQPDMNEWANEAVVPLFIQRPRRPAEDWPDYDTELAWLTSIDIPKDVHTVNSDQEIRAFLKDPQWPFRLPELRALVRVAEGAWSAPFLEILKRATASWWMFWVTKPPPAHVVASLHVLKNRPIPQAKGLVGRLCHHQDERIRGAATALWEVYNAAEAPLPAT